LAASLVGPGVSRVALLWAGLTAATIGTYTTLDAAGARRSSGLGYGIAIVVGAGLVLSAAIVASGRAGRLVPGVRREWPRFLVGGACSTLATRWSWRRPVWRQLATSRCCASPR